MSRPNRTDTASVLIEAADAVKKHYGLVLPAPDDRWLMEGVNRVAVGLKLRERPALALRAMMEGWDLDRIVRELN